MKLVGLLRDSGIRKAQGIKVSQVFDLLLLFAFQKKLISLPGFKRSGNSIIKNTYYRFLNTSTYNWRLFLTSLTAKVIASFSRLTRPDRVKVFVLDDSAISRNRSKHVELLANLYDHADNRFIKGFTMLVLGWTDGYSFVPTDFVMMLSAFKSTKTLMKLGTEFQGQSYDMMISHTTIVFTRNILLEWLRRDENDDKTL